MEHFCQVDLDVGFKVSCNFRCPRSYSTETFHQEGEAIDFLVLQLNYQLRRVNNLNSANSSLSSFFQSLSRATLFLLAKAHNLSLLGRRLG